jgi:AraC-like DNA-binding protein
MPAAAAREEVRIWQPTGLAGLQLMQASYLHRSFPRHTHEGFGVGVIEHGALGFFYRGENVVAPAGQINLVNPDEVHTGQSATDDGWTYRMFYFGADLLQRAASEMAGKQVRLPFFTTGVIDDSRLAGLIRESHLRLTDAAIPLLEKESRLLHMLVQLIARHADIPPPLRPVGREHRGVKKAIDYIAAFFHEEISVEQLAAVACLSPYHFIRVFCRHTGLPPHAWLMQFRVFAARRLLQQGVAIADAACLAGFTDQSHLTRSFKRLLGYTPGQFSNSVQDA